jgi:hypothetical protein
MYTCVLVNPYCRLHYSALYGAQCDEDIVTVNCYRLCNPRGYTSHIDISVGNKEGFRLHTVLSSDFCEALFGDSCTLG